MVFRQIWLFPGKQLNYGFWAPLYWPCRTLILALASHILVPSYPILAMASYPPWVHPSPAPVLPVMTYTMLGGVRIGHEAQIGAIHAATSELGPRLRQY